MPAIICLVSCTPTFLIVLFSSNSCRGIMAVCLAALQRLLAFRDIIEETVTGDYD